MKTTHSGGKSEASSSLHLFTNYKPNGKETWCKYCNNKYIEQIPTGATVQSLFSWLHLNHFKCEVCLQKFYKTDIEKMRNSFFLLFKNRPAQVPVER